MYPGGEVDWYLFPSRPLTRKIYLSRRAAQDSTTSCEMFFGKPPMRKNLGPKRSISKKDTRLT